MIKIVDVIVNADIVTAFVDVTVGTKVTDTTNFLLAAVAAIAKYDFEAQRVPGQGFIMCPEAVPFVSAGVGPRSSKASDFVCREHRGVVGAFLKREFAAQVEGCALIVYTLAAYLADPDVTPAEAVRVVETGATHVLVAVLAFAGPKAPLSPYRLVGNLAGGNNEALAWTADEIRAKAKESMEYDSSWAIVAD